nr:BAHD acyltransferase [Echium plantagineum]
MASYRVKLISKKLIKPSISTPPPPRSYKLGLMDQLLDNVYMPLAFFYPNIQNNNGSPLLPTNIPSLVQNSLSKVLAAYYPLAGRAVDNLNIDCSEMKATFIEADVDCRMSEITSNPNISAQDVIFPTGLTWRSSKDDDSLVIAQLNHFSCGGKALNLCASHKVADGLTLSNFARDWAAVTKQSGLLGDHQEASPLSPQLNAASIIPPIEDPLTKAEFGLFPHQQNCVTKRLLFDSSKLGELKAKVTGETGIKNPTRMEVVTALVHKHAHAAASIVDPNSSQLPIFIQVVNMRPLINPPLSQNYVGNLSNYFGIPLPNAKDLSHSKLVSELRKAKVEFFDKFKGISANDFRKEIIKSVEYMRMISDGESNLDQYICTNMCRFPFYDTDFGWGKPERVNFAASPFKNFLILLDEANGDGVEAFVALEEKIMNAFERDPEILKFASIR